MNPPRAVRAGLLDGLRFVWQLLGSRRQDLRRALLARAGTGALQALPAVVVIIVVDDLSTGPASVAEICVLSTALLAGLLAALLVTVPANRILWTASYQAGGELRTRLLAQLRRLPVSVHLSRRSGDTLTALTHDPQALEDLLGWSLASIAADAVLPVVVIVALTVVDLPLSLLVVGSVAVSLPAALWAQRRYTRFTAARQELQARAVSRMVEHIQGAAVIHAFNQGEQRRRALSDALADFRAANRAIVRSVIPAYQLFTALLGLGLPLLLVAGGYWLGAGRISAHVLIAFVVLSPCVYQRVLQVADHLEAAPVMAASLRRVRRLLDTPAQVEATSSSVPAGFDIVLDGVSFGYKSGVPVLHEISFTVPERSTIAIVGPSGAGKTTVLSLLARFWDPDAGSIYLGGRDLRELGAEDFHRHLSIVFQEAYLFEGSVFDNIAAGRPQASRSAVLAAASAAGCDEFVAELPAGFDTLVGEGGARLSTGQRQRVALARAIVKDAPVVLLDEATAALDPANERHVQQALEVLARDKTLVVVAHRLSTVRAADQIIALDGGRLVEAGTHDELVDRGGLYARLWRRREQAAGWRLSAATRPASPTSG